MSRARKATVLLVDDDEDLRSLRCAVLGKRGYIVDAVDSADSCLARLAQAPAVWAERLTFELAEAVAR